MFDQVVLLWSLIFLLMDLFQVAKKALTMAIPWKRLADLPTGAPKRPKQCMEENPAPERRSNLVLAPKPRVGDEREGFECKKAARIARMRPTRIVIPESCVSLGLSEACDEGAIAREAEVEGKEYCLASRKGSRHAMEDGYAVITNINGNSNQAFFGVYDGHGGRSAVDFVSDKLGKNIITALAEQKEEDQLEGAVKAGYLTTDKEFISQGVRSGACAATVLLKDGELHVANVGDCRVVMSRKGVANALTNDHRASRDDERIRIESSGGYVNCHNGVWRVQDSLAISRAIGDASMKEWIISEPETKKLRLTSDCEFLIIASDGLWDKVANQEAVNIVSAHNNTLQACKDLVTISSTRGSRDDITVMIVDLQKFIQGYDEDGSVADYRLFDHGNGNLELKDVIGVKERTCWSSTFDS